MLTGLSCYVEALKSNGMPEFLINEAIKIGLGKAKEEPPIEVKHNGDKIEFNNMPKDKEMEVLEKFLDIIKDSLGD